MLQQPISDEANNAVGLLYDALRYQENVRGARDRVKALIADREARIRTLERDLAEFRRPAPVEVSDGT